MSRAPWFLRRRSPAKITAAAALLYLALWILAALFVGCSSCAQSATLTIRGQAPAYDNAGTCAAPSLTPSAGAALVTVFVQVTGPAAFLDSLQVASGLPFAFVRTVPAGSYTVRSWASDAGGVGCDTTVTVTVKNPPWRVRL